MSRRPSGTRSSAREATGSARVDRLVQAVEQTVVGYGVRVTLRADDPEKLEALLAALPGRWRASNNGGADRVFSLVGDERRGRRYVLYRDDSELIRTRDMERVVEHLVGSVGFYFAERSSQRTFLHSGAVAWQGRAIVLPGRQNSGKTTLTAALVRAGATYLSDDFAPIDDRGRVHPFPRPLSVRQKNGRPPKLHRVEDLGGVQEKRALPIGLVVFAPYTGARRWRPRRLPPGQGVLALLRYTASAQTRPREALERLGQVVAVAPVLKGGRGEADDAVELILRRLNAVVDGTDCLSIKC